MIPGSRPYVVVLTADGVAPPANEAALRDLADLTYTDATGLADALPGADVLLMWDFFSSALADAWHAAGDLRWVHVAAAGVDAILFDGLIESEVVLTNAHGVFDRPIAEFVAATILARDKLLHESERLQRQRIWRHRESRTTAGSTALVVGTGGIGRACARLLRALGIEVQGVGRVAREDDPDLGVVHASTDLAAHVGWADHLVLAAPLTPQTRGLVDAGVLAAMRPSAHLVNVGRGALLVEEDLLAALRDGTIEAASLDVFDTEPLPDEHPFWHMENVHVFAHRSGDVIGWRDALARQFADNLRTYAAGDPLIDPVDKAAGYRPRPGV